MRPVSDQSAPNQLFFLFKCKSFLNHPPVAETASLFLPLVGQGNLSMEYLPNLDPVEGA